jgi:hypothetical protein
MCYSCALPMAEAILLHAEFTSVAALSLSTQIRCSIVVSISACHAEDPGSIPGGGVLLAASLRDVARN